MATSDQMLKNLQEKLSVIEVQSRGTCASCRTPIYGRMNEANNQQFHPEHFCCSRCHQVLGTEKFFLVGEDFVCARCVNKSANLQCAGCGQVIEGQAVEALGKNWHINHFNCSRCSTAIEGNYYDVQGSPVCQNCVNKG